MIVMIQDMTNDFTIIHISEHKELPFDEESLQLQIILCDHGL